jgi:hypothetical protein
MSKVALLAIEMSSLISDWKVLKNWVSESDWG